MVFCCIKQIFLITALFGFASVGTRVAALELAVLNDITEMVKSKKIMLKVAFSPSEKLVYREMLRFSSSNRLIVLRFWKASAAAKKEYVASFHQPKRVFTESFELELTFEALNVDEGALPRVLAQTNVAISYVALDAQQKHNAQTAFVNCAGQKVSDGNTNNETFGPEATVLEVQLSQVLSGTQQAASSDDSVLVPVVDDEIFYLKRGEAFYQQVYYLLARIIDIWGIFFIVFIILMAAVMIGIRLLLRKYPQALQRYYPTKFEHLIFVLTPIACLGIIGFCGAPGVALIALSAYSLLLGCYLLITQSEQQDFTPKSLGLLGSFLVISALPLFLKGFLLFFAGQA